MTFLGQNCSELASKSAGKDLNELTTTALLWRWDQWADAWLWSSMDGQLVWLIEMLSEGELMVS